MPENIPVGEDEELRRSDMVLIGASIRRGWNIPEELKDALPKKLVQIIADPNSTNRTRISATRLLVIMEANNRQCEQPQQNINVNVDAADPATAVEIARLIREEDADYAEYQRSRIEDTDTGDLGGEPPTVVEPGETSS